MNNSPRYGLVAIFSFFFLGQLYSSIEELLIGNQFGNPFYLVVWGYLAVLSYKNNLKLIYSSLLWIIGIQIVAVMLVAYFGYNLDDALRQETFPNFVQDTLGASLGLILTIAVLLYVRSQRSQSQLTANDDATIFEDGSHSRESEIDRLKVSPKTRAKAVNRSRHRKSTIEDVESDDFHILLEYDKEVAECYEKILKTTEEIARKFRLEVVRDKTRSKEIMLSLLAEYGRSLAPYKNQLLNDALREAQRYGPNAEQDFKNVVRVTGETVSAEKLLGNIREKYAKTPHAESIKVTHWAVSRGHSSGEDKSRTREPDEPTAPVGITPSPYITIDRFSDNDKETKEREDGVSILDILKAVVLIIFWGWILWRVWHELIPWLLS